MGTQHLAQVCNHHSNDEGLGIISQFSCTGMHFVESVCLSVTHSETHTHNLLPSLWEKQRRYHQHADPENWETGMGGCQRQWMQKMPHTREHLSWVWNQAGGGAVRAPWPQTRRPTGLWGWLSEASGHVGVDSRQLSEKLLSSYSLKSRTPNEHFLHHTRKSLWVWWSNQPPVA